MTRQELVRYVASSGALQPAFTYIVDGTGLTTPAFPESSSGG